MKLYQFNSKEELFIKLGQEFKHFLKLNHDLKIVLATGQTMIPFYQSLQSTFEGDYSPLQKQFYYNLDEYCDLGKLHPSSFHAYMNHYFDRPYSIPKGHHFIPDGNAIDKDKEAQFYEDQVSSPHLAFLGLGLNGHIGFNEPGTSFRSKTRVVTLSEMTRKANQSSFYQEEVPQYAISMGIQTILNAKKIILIVTQGTKANILAQCLDKMDENFPASSLLSHPQVSVLATQEVYHSLKGEWRERITAGKDFLI
jgi:glucosamine-6-phosphate deaminase